MYFLGQASNYKALDVLRHTFAFGTKADATRLREHLSKRYKVPTSHTALYGTGRSALTSALKSIASKSKNGQKPEVAITALTCFAVVQAVKAAGCTPIFVDANSKTLHFGATELKKTLSLHPDIVAVIVQNNLGHPIDITSIEKIAKSHSLKIIEDLAHCTGVHYPDGREAGTIGDATVLSFGKGKSIDTIAGGALVLRNRLASQPAKRPSLCNSMRARWYPFFGVLIRLFYHIKLGRLFTSLLLKLHFIERSADAPLSLNTRCTYWQAKLALHQLENLPDPRPPLREFYLVKHRDATLDKLEKNGFIFNDTWYDCPVAPERYFKKSEFNPKECPNAVKLAQEIINVPTHYPKDRLEPARAIIEDDLITKRPSKKEDTK